MVRALSKYSLLSISPPQSQFERHNAVELQPITERRTGPLHRRSSVPYICLRRGYLGLRSTTCAPREWWERGSSPGGYLETSVDQLVTLLFAKYAREVAKALPSDQRILCAARKNTRRASRHKRSYRLSSWQLIGHAHSIMSSKQRNHGRPTKGRSTIRRRSRIQGR